MYDATLQKVLQLMNKTETTNAFSAKVMNDLKICRTAQNGYRHYQCNVETVIVQIVGR